MNYKVEVRKRIKSKSIVLRENIDCGNDVCYCKKWLGKPEDRPGFIYKMINPEGKIYIGQTIDPEVRSHSYKYDKYYNNKIGISLNKYGFDKHNFEVIEKCLCGLNKSILNEREIYWIKFYNSYENGLNSTPGNMGPKGYKKNEEKLSYLIFTEEQKNEIIRLKKQKMGDCEISRLFGVSDTTIKTRLDEWLKNYINV